jgi:hypothetical protein
MVSIELSSRVYPGFAVVALAGDLDAASGPAAAVALQDGIGPGRRVFGAGDSLPSLPGNSR